MNRMFALLRVVFLALCFTFAAPALAQDKSGAKPGFTLKPGTAKIVLMRPSVRVGTQSAGGSFTPNADWTAQARENLHTAFVAAQASLGSEVIPYEESPSDGSKLAQYNNLFSALAGSVIEYQFFKGNRLPTKKRKDQFEWSIGPDIASLSGLQGADYALFVTTEDHIGSTGRKLLQIAAAFGGVGVTSGVHKGYAGLIDLKTGELVWLNADLQMGGDVRNAEGAEKRVRQLLDGFPGKTPDAAGTD